MAQSAASAARRAGRAFVLVLGLCAVLFVAAWLLRAPLAEGGARRALAGAGMQDAEVEVRVLTATQAVARVALPDGPSATIQARYDWRTLMSERRVATLRVSDAVLTIIADADGARIEGLDALPSGGDGGGRLPFDVVTADDLTVTLVTPAGRATATARGRYDLTGSDATGEGSATLRGDAGMAGTGVEGAEASASVSLSPNGTLSAEIRLTGAVTAGGRSAEDVALQGTFAATRWRTGALDEARGEGRVTLASARTAAGGADLAVAGAADIALADGVVRAAPMVTVTRDDGARAGLEDGFLVTYDLADGTGAAKGPLTFDLPQAMGTARVDLSGEAGDIVGAVSADLQRATIAGIVLGEASWTGEASVRGDAAILTGEADALLDAWAIGPVTVRDVPVRGRLEARYGLEDGTLSITAPDCVAAPRAAAIVGETAVRLGGVTVCADGPMFVSAEDGAVFKAMGTLRADRFETEINEMPVTGQDAVLAFAADERVADGTLDVPVIDLPMDLRATSVAVTGTAGTAGLDYKLTGARIAQVLDAPVVAPVMLTGAGRASERITFDGALTTPRGEALGTVTLRQDPLAGEATLRASDLVFAPGGLQPARLLPALRGVIAEATGTASVTARAAWSEDAEPQTSAELTLDDLSFQGPGLTVQRTEGLSGDIALASLLPLRSAGEQVLRVRLIDLGAIQLPSGEAAFTLPGDGTLALARAGFPWMGGQLRVADATFAADGDAEVVLRAEGVQLSQLFAIVDIDGLSGEGVLDGALPLIADAFAIDIDGGAFTSRGPGVIRYAGRVSKAVSAGQGAKLAFSGLEELRFDELSGTVSGPLDGSLLFGMRMEGTSRVDLGNPLVAERLTTPVIYNIEIEAPVLALIDQARLTTDRCRQAREAGADAKVVRLLCFGSEPLGAPRP